MKKLNIAEMLKDCPKGMELDCIMCDNVYLDEVTPQMIKCYIKNDVYNTIYFHHDGTYLTTQNAKCVIFPKGKTTWEGFQRPFKDGDILATDLGSVFFLNTRLNTDERYGCYVGIGGDGSFHICAPFAYKECCGLATEEEKQKLFDAIKANGYKWNAKTKTLEKLIEPKFKVGDRIKKKGIDKIYAIEIASVEQTIYMLKSGGFQDIESTDKDYELVLDKFDIASLKAFESRVLVRDKSTDEWRGQFFSHYYNCSDRPYICIGIEGLSEHKQCIPFKGNEYLLGTTDDCDEYYKTWE